jgi:hypothetical protein
MMMGGLLRLEMGSYTHPKRRLAGTVYVNSAGAARQVAAFGRGTMEYLGSTVSNSDGSWEISGMKPMPDSSIFAVAFDTGTYNAEALDLLTQVE